jgi:hypothetical protein
LQCEQAQLHLFEFADGGLTSSLRGDIDQHLQSCDACSELLQGIWEMELKSTAWTDINVPGWNRRDHFFGSRQSFSWFQLAGAMSSVLVLILVLFRAELSSDESGFQISFGGPQDYVSSQEFDFKLRELAIQNQRNVDASMGDFGSAQIAANQLMLRTMLAASRSERREDLGTMMTVWDQDRKRMEESTEESVRFLLRNQMEGRREIGNLTNVLNTITNQRDNNL